eukprot:7134063-Pyramimonas_sp.AAC.1
MLASSEPSPSVSTVPEGGNGTCLVKTEERRLVLARSAPGVCVCVCLVSPRVERALRIFTRPVALRSRPATGPATRPAYARVPLAPRARRATCRTPSAAVSRSSPP